MSEREMNVRYMAEVMGLCYEISTHSDADCFFNYSPHVNSFDVQVFEFGWAVGAKGEYYAFSQEVNQDNLMDASEKLYALRAKLGGGLRW